MSGKIGSHARFLQVIHSSSGQSITRPAIPVAVRQLPVFVTDSRLACSNFKGAPICQAIDCPFRAADAALAKLQTQCKMIIVDFHADATAEKIAMGWHLDGKVSAVLGTHTHVQTADARILPNGTAYITDVGMTGPYDSVLGMQKEIALKRFILQTAHKYETATDDVRLCGANVVLDEQTGKALSIEPFMYPEPARKVG
jgi:metallophosphoesterase (TIGR00282 family)